ncbi:alpha/beta-hydrolase [Aureobasidium melanogenum CBS 110374]|uniref:Alpha/beta-hydrolase n=1 Tax=Aureobasidium melanogenum (strain CBS 110374) TaxID=1043003 RepID=A0A074W7V9_AURM1|nr:alpha/beta-hydrolase [Aureobasidium melanogenum CBS 110374]KEQ67654.1 alpha/beta-hydrolase [Aureobasidium melanogenum CBS 110374]
MEAIDNYVVQPTTARSHTIIMLHGRDSVASEFAEELFESQASDNRTLPQIYPGFKWVFPNSGLLKSERFDMELPQWFDMWGTEKPHDEEGTSRVGIQKATARIVDLIRAESKLVPLDHIFLGGISQGAAVAIHSLLRGGLQIGGYLGFCTWLPFHDEVKSEALSSTPISPEHNKDDEVISIDNGESMREVLQHLGPKVTCRTYGTGGHWFNEPRGIDDLIAFLTTCGVSNTD